MTTETVICWEPRYLPRFNERGGGVLVVSLRVILVMVRIRDMYPLTWLLRSYDLVKHDLVSPDFIIAPIDPNIKKNIIENTLRHLVETSLFSVKSGVGKTLTITQYHTL